MDLTARQRADFLETLWDYYAHHGRVELPWRLPEPDGTFDPYKIMVSELMLQQTQVGRVIPKYHAFLQAFPTIEALASAGLGDVLRLWQGLGYNRRAKFLWQAAQAIEALGYFPTESAGLTALPGIGPNTAGAILAYAFNQPVIFVETNVRTVYLHHFFSARIGVADTDIRSFLVQTLDHEHARDFYWALMDYGTYLKTTVGNLNRASKHYAKQSKFHGSRRAVRGQVIRLLGERPRSAGELAGLIPDERLDTVLTELTREALIHKNADTYSLD